MTHVILGHCCKDASCVAVCPQNCIHPAPGEDGFAAAETLHIDPRACIDCTACVEACPADAIKSEHELTPPERVYAARNREFFPVESVAFRPPLRRRPRSIGNPGDRLRIAVVGSGPAAMYTVRELLRRSTSVRVTVFERYGEVGGLLHRAVSPDHVGVRGMIRLFDVPFADDRVDVVYDTEVGVDVSVGQLRDGFDAVVLAYGASEPRRFGAEGGPGRRRVHQALDLLVAANLPSAAAYRPRQLGPKCVIVGAGNVAFDVVRHIARRSASVAGVTELTVLSRSPLDRASFTPSAFYELLDLDNVEIVLDEPDGESNRSAVVPLAGVDAGLLGKRGSGGAAGRLRVVLSFGQHVTDIDASAQAGVVVRTESGRTFAADSVICAAGFTTKEIDGIPRDERGAVCNRRGQVVAPETGEPVDRLYVVGWAKRGATGGIGDNRLCAAETVEQMAADLAGLRAESAPGHPARDAAVR